MKDIMRMKEEHFFIERSSSKEVIFDRRNKKNTNLKKIKTV